MEDPIGAERGRSHRPTAPERSGAIRSRAHRWIGPGVAAVAFVVLVLSMPTLGTLLVNKDHGY